MLWFGSGLAALALLALVIVSATTSWLFNSDEKNHLAAAAFGFVHKLKLLPGVRRMLVATPALEVES